MSKPSKHGPDVESRRTALRARRRLAASLALMSLLGWSLVLVALPPPPSRPAPPADARFAFDTDRAIPVSFGGSSR